MMFRSKRTEEFGCNWTVKFLDHSDSFGFFFYNTSTFIMTIQKKQKLQPIKICSNKALTVVFLFCFFLNLHGYK